MKRGKLWNEHGYDEPVQLVSPIRKPSKAITSVRRPKMKRDAGVKCCLFTIKRQHFTPASLFIFGRRTDDTVLDTLRRKVVYIFIILSVKVVFYDKISCPWNQMHVFFSRFYYINKLYFCQILYVQ